MGLGRCAIWTPRPASGAPKQYWTRSPAGWRTRAWSRTHRRTRLSKQGLTGWVQSDHTTLPRLADLNVDREGRMGPTVDAMLAKAPLIAHLSEPTRERSGSVSTPLTGRKGPVFRTHFVLP
jgi:hypothetical protein